MAAQRADRTEDSELARLRARVAELEGLLDARAREGAATPEPESAPRVQKFAGHDEQLAAIERIVQLGRWTWDVVDNTVWWSDGFFAILGQDPAQDVASFEAFFAALHPDDLAWVTAAAYRPREGAWSPDSEMRVIRRDGSVREVRFAATAQRDGAGRLRRLVGLCLDVTNARASERRLERTLADLEEAQTIASVGSWVLDASSGQLEWSTELRRVLGVGPGVEPSMLEMCAQVHDDDRAKFVALHERILAGEHQGEVDVRARSAGSAARQLKAREVAKRDPDGRLLAVRGTIADVTEARRLAAQIAHAQKMEAIGQLSAGVAHDLNNHLLVMQGSMYLLGLPASEELEALERAFDAARQTTARLSAFARQAPLTRCSLEVDGLVRDGLLLLAGAMPCGVTITTSIAHRLDPIVADRGLFTQCLVNLVLNARDAFERTGRITVGAAASERPGFIAVEVRDNGCGMDPTVRERAFEPFFTTKPMGKGSGLGLAMVHGTLAQHGGEVSIDSVMGVGTTVTMLWPTASAGRRPEAPLARDTEPKIRATILLVEDQVAVANVVAGLLRAEQHQVIVADGPAAALALVEQRGRSSIDLIVSDVMMPEMRGPALVDALTAKLGERPAVLFMTGHADEASEIAERHLLMRKPFTLVELRAGLAAALRERPPVKRTSP
jgi:PAS domain S-box-containing protein